MLQLIRLIREMTLLIRNDRETDHAADDRRQSVGCRGCVDMHGSKDSQHKTAFNSDADRTPTVPIATTPLQQNAYVHCICPSVNVCPSFICLAVSQFFHVSLFSLLNNIIISPPAVHVPTHSSTAHVLLNRPIAMDDWIDGASGCTSFLPIKHSSNFIFC